MPMTFEEWLLLVEYVLLTRDVQMYEIPRYLFFDAFNRGVMPWQITDEEWMNEFEKSVGK